MPDKTVALLMRFLEQGDGGLSEWAKNKEFSALTDEETAGIEEKYREVFRGMRTTQRTPTFTFRKRGY